MSPYEYSNPMSPEETWKFESQDKTHEVFTSLPRHAHPIAIPKSVKQLYSVRFVAAHGTPTLWNPALPRLDPVHLWGDRQQIVSPVVFALDAVERDATWRANGGGDFARMDLVVEDGGAYEDWAVSIQVLSRTCRG